MHGDGLSPNLYSFNGAIAACATGGAWEEALLLLQVSAILALLHSDHEGYCGEGTIHL